MSDGSPMHFAEICQENYALRAQVVELRKALKLCLPFVSRYEEQYRSNIALDACYAARAALEKSGGVK